VVELSAVTPELAAGVLALAPTPEQERNAPRAAVTLPAALADPERHAVTILENGRPVGFFALDEGYASRVLASSARPVGLRGFFVDARHQGRGIATRAIERLPAHVRERLPGATSVLLTVGPDNPAARRVYVAAGFVSTGRTWDHGPSGPQEALELAL
jgi:RimJ/RimL family protein N-acetyltransferase